MTRGLDVDAQLEGSVMLHISVVHYEVFGNERRCTCYHDQYEQVLKVLNHSFAGTAQIIRSYSFLAPLVPEASPRWDAALFAPRKL